MIGSPNASHIIVSLFDYTCHQCRALHPMLVEAQNRLGQQLAIVSLPMPLCTNCNPSVTHYFRAHALACDYAKLGLAVWRANRKVSRQFDDWLFAPPHPVPLEQARQYAARLVGADNLARALSDDWIARQIRFDGSLYATNYQRLHRSELPEVMMGPAVSFGPLNNVNELYSLLDRTLGLKVEKK